MPSRGSPSSRSRRLPAYRRTCPSSSAYDASLERREAGALREHRRADREVAGQHVARPGAAGPGTSIQPIRQPVIEKYLLKLANTTASRLVSQALRASRSCRRAGVLDAVVDLVADQLHLLGLAPPGQRGELARQQHRAGRVGRAGDDQPLEAVLRVELGDLLDGRLEPGLRAGRDLDDLDAERGEHVAVAGVAGPGHRDLVADLERRQERQQEPAAAAGGHDDLVGVDVDRRSVRRWWPAIASRSSRIPTAGV